jgi:transposase
MAFTYAPGRGGHHAERVLQGFAGILQVDGYAGYNRLIAPDRAGPDIQLADCWAHARRELVEITRTGLAPIAEDGVKRSANSIGSKRNCAAFPQKLGLPGGRHGQLR